MSITGRIHSTESGGMVDGPGIRFVIFTQGCRLRCQYCHNPDTWKPTGGTEVTAEAMVREALSYRNFMNASGGGITISGGEPLLQPEFVTAIFDGCHKAGLHTTLDTAGWGDLHDTAPVLDRSDLVLLDIKAARPDLFKQVSGATDTQTWQTLDYLLEHHTPVWIRHVVVPGLTADPDDLKLLAERLTPYDNIEKIELLPFHKLGEYKWAELGCDYRLTDTEPPAREAMQAAREIFQKAGLAA